MEKLGADARTALVLLTHDPKLDDPALEIGLNPNCFTSVRWDHHARMPNVEPFKRTGVHDDQIGRIHGPLG